jgi:hypothetical protein
MREIRLYGSEGGGAARSPYPYPNCDERRHACNAPSAILILPVPRLSFFHPLDGCLEPLEASLLRLGCGDPLHVFFSVAIAEAS